MHHLAVLLDGGRGVPQRLETTREEPTLVAAIVGAVRDAEAGGHHVVGIVKDRQDVLVAADLIVRLREVAKGVSEEDMAVLLDLLPL